MTPCSVLKPHRWLLFLFLPLCITHASEYQIRNANLVGEHEFAHHGNIQVGENTTLESGANVIVKSTRSIKFMRGTQFKLGSHFRAIPGSVISSSKLVENDDYYFSKHEDLLISSENGITANDNPSLDGQLIELISPPKSGNLLLFADGSFSYTAYPSSGNVFDNFIYGILENPLAGKALVTLNFIDTDGDGMDDNWELAVGSDPFTANGHEVAPLHGLSLFELYQLGLNPNVPPSNMAPLAQDDAYFTTTGNLLEISALNGILANDSDEDGDDLIAELISPPVSGNLQFFTDGSFNYMPGLLSGEVSFSYRVLDGEGGEAIGQANLVISSGPFLVLETPNEGDQLPAHLLELKGVISPGDLATWMIDKDPLASEVSLSLPQMLLMAGNVNHGASVNVLVSGNESSLDLEFLSVGTAQSLNSYRAYETTSTVPEFLNSTIYQLGHDEVISFHLGFAFPFSGNLYEDLFVSRVGGIFFAEDEVSVPISVNDLPIKRVIAPLWQDLDLSSGNLTTYTGRVNGPRSTAFRWRGLNASDREVDVTCILYHDGRIEFQYGYGNLFDPQHPPVVGISSGDGFNFLLDDSGQNFDYGSHSTLVYTAASLPQSAGFTSEIMELATHVLYPILSEKEPAIRWYARTGHSSTDVEQHPWLLWNHPLASQGNFIQLRADVDVISDTLKMNPPRFTYSTNNLPVTFEMFPSSPKLGEVTLSGNLIGHPIEVEVNLTITHGPPVAVNDEIQIIKGTSIEINPLANDVDDLDQLSLFAHEEVSEQSGSIILHSGNSLIYTPDPLFAGTDRFNYTITDGTYQANAQIIISVFDADLDTTPPSIDILQPRNGQVLFQGELPGVSEGTSANSMEFMARITDDFHIVTEANLIVNSELYSTPFQKSGPDFRWVIDEPLVEGEHSIEIQARDRKGNLSRASLKFSVQDGVPTDINQDLYYVLSGETLVVPEKSGVMANDIAYAETQVFSHLVAVQQFPSTGSHVGELISFGRDGSFEFQSEAGAIGYLEFEYAVGLDVQGADNSDPKGLARIQVLPQPGALTVQPVVQTLLEGSDYQSFELAEPGETLLVIQQPNLGKVYLEKGSVRYQSFSGQSGIVTFSILKETPSEGGSEATYTRYDFSFDVMSNQETISEVTFELLGTTVRANLPTWVTYSYWVVEEGLGVDIAFVDQYNIQVLSNIEQTIELAMVYGSDDGSFSENYSYEESLSLVSDVRPIFPSDLEIVGSTVNAPLTLTFEIMGMEGYSSENVQLTMGGNLLPINSEGGNHFSCFVESIGDGVHFVNVEALSDTGTVVSKTWSFTLVTTDILSRVEAFSGDQKIVIDWDLDFSTISDEILQEMDGLLIESSVLGTNTIVDIDGTIVMIGDEPTYYYSKLFNDLENGVTYDFVVTALLNNRRVGTSYSLSATPSVFDLSSVQMNGRQLSPIYEDEYWADYEYGTTGLGAPSRKPGFISEGSGFIGLGAESVEPIRVRVSWSEAMTIDPVYDDGAFLVTNYEQGTTHYEMAYNYGWQWSDGYFPHWDGVYIRLTRLANVLGETEMEEKYISINYGIAYHMQMEPTYYWGANENLEQNRVVGVLDQFGGNRISFKEDYELIFYDGAYSNVRFDGYSSSNGSVHSFSQSQDYEHRIFTLNEPTGLGVDTFKFYFNTDDIRASLEYSLETIQRFDYQPNQTDFFEGQHLTDLSFDVIDRHRNYMSAANNHQFSGSNMNLSFYSHNLETDVNFEPNQLAFRANVITDTLRVNPNTQNSVQFPYNMTAVLTSVQTSGNISEEFQVNGHLTMKSWMNVDDSFSVFSGQKAKIRFPSVPSVLSGSTYLEAGSLNQTGKVSIQEGSTTYGFYPNEPGDPENSEQAGRGNKDVYGERDGVVHCVLKYRREPIGVEDPTTILPISRSFSFRVFEGLTMDRNHDGLITESDRFQEGAPLHTYAWGGSKSPDELFPHNGETHFIRPSPEGQEYGHYLLDHSYLYLKIDIPDEVNLESTQCYLQLDNLQRTVGSLSEMRFFHKDGSSFTLLNSGNLISNNYRYYLNDFIQTGDQTYEFAVGPVNSGSYDIRYVIWTQEGIGTSTERKREIRFDFYECGFGNNDAMAPSIRLNDSMSINLNRGNLNLSMKVADSLTGAMSSGLTAYWNSNDFFPRSYPINTTSVMKKNGFRTNLESELIKYTIPKEEGYEVHYIFSSPSGSRHAFVPKTESSTNYSSRTLPKAEMRIMDDDSIQLADGEGVIYHFNGMEGGLVSSISGGFGDLGSPRIFDALTQNGTIEFENPTGANVEISFSETTNIRFYEKLNGADQQDIYKISNDRFGRLRQIEHQRDSVCGSGNSTMDIFYEPTGTRVVDFNGAETIYQFDDELNFLTRKIYNGIEEEYVPYSPGEGEPAVRLLGQENLGRYDKRYTYDENFQLESIGYSKDDEEPNIYESYVYDSSVWGRPFLESQTVNGGTKVFSRFEDTILPRTIEDASGNIWTHDYLMGDAHYELHTVTSPHETIVTYTDYVLGKPRRVTQPDGTFTTYEYDSHGRMTEEVDSLGFRKGWSYFPNSKNYTFTDHDDSRTSYQHDPLGRLIQTKNEENVVNATYYDLLGRKVRQSTFLEADDTGLKHLLVGDLVWDYSQNGSLIVEDHYRELGAGQRTDYSRKEYNLHGDLLRERGNTDLSSVSDSETWTVYGDTENEGWQNSIIRPGENIGMRYEHDELGRVVRVRNEEHSNAHPGEITNYYPNTNLVEEKITADGNITRYEYEADGQLRKMTNPKGGYELYSYYDNRKLHKVQSYNSNGTPYGNPIETLYNSNWDPIGEVDRLGVTRTRERKLIGGVPSIEEIIRVDEIEIRRVDALDSEGRIESKTLPTGQVINFNHQDSGRTTVVSGVGMGETTIKRDLLRRRTGQVIEIEDGQELRSHIRFHPRSGLRAEKTYPSGAVETYSDSSTPWSNLMTKNFSSEIDSQVTERTVQGQPSEIEVNGEGTQVMEYLSDGRLKRTFYPAGEIMTRGYTPGGHLRFEEIRRGTSTDRILYTRDGLGNVVEVATSWGSLFTFGYDDFGKLTSETEHIQGKPPRTIIYEYYTDTKLLKKKIGLGGRTELYGYNALGQITIFKNPKQFAQDDSLDSGRCTFYVYDEHGRLTEKYLNYNLGESASDVLVETMGYNDLNQVVTHHNRRNIVKEIRYDLAGRKKEEEFYLAGNPRDSVLVASPKNGGGRPSRLETHSASGTSSLQFHEDVNGVSTGLSLEDTFLSLSRLTNGKIDSKRLGSWELNHRYYDDSSGGQLKGIELTHLGESGELTTPVSPPAYHYFLAGDDTGRLKMIDYGNGRKRTFSYLSGGRLHGVTELQDEIETTTRLHDYYSNGDLKSILTLSSDSSSNLVYHYDDAGRLEREVHWETSPWEKQYVYDLNDNIVAEEIRALSGGGEVLSVSSYQRREYNGLDQVTEIYDSSVEGNILEVFRYNGEGQMTRRAFYDNGFGSNVHLVTITYDLLGRQTQVTRYSDANFTSLDGGDLYSRQRISYFGPTFMRKAVQVDRHQGHPIDIATRYIWDDEGNVISMETTENGQLMGRSIYLHHEGKPMYRVDERADGTLKGFNYTTDSLNNVTGLIDQDGNTVMTAQYDAWGSATFYDTSGNVITPFDDIPDALIAHASMFGYRNQLHDLATGEIYMRHRQVIPELGIFTTPDPLGENGGTYGLYSYVSGDPIQYQDFSGLAAYFFDGTNNHPNAKNSDGTSNYQTNVWHLFSGYIGGDAFYMPGIGSGYKPRVLAQGQSLGGDGTAGIQWYQGATGKSMVARANAMIGQLEKQMAKGDFDVDLFGFSRGSATAMVFLNHIHKQMERGAHGYKDLNIRFVSLFDSVPSELSLAHAGAGRTLDTLGYLGSLSMWSPNTYARNANDSEFLLPSGMKFAYKPLHLVALDERRKEFAVTDLQGADQIGLPGVHSNVGGGYGGSLFEFIARNEVLNRADGFGLNLFDRSQVEESAFKNYSDPSSYATHAALYKKYSQYSIPYAPTSSYSGFRNAFRGRLMNLTHRPTDNSAAKFNDNEPRHLPAGMRLHPSVFWFSYEAMNALR